MLAVTCAVATAADDDGDEVEEDGESFCIVAVSTMKESE